MFEAIGMKIVKTRGCVGQNVRWIVKTRGVVGLAARWSVKTRGFMDPGAWGSRKSPSPSAAANGGGNHNKFAPEC